jgi:hypothetical protein
MAGPWEREQVREKGDDRRGCRVSESERERVSARERVMLLGRASAAGLRAGAGECTRMGRASARSTVPIWEKKEESARAVVFFFFFKNVNNSSICLFQ